MSRKCHFIVVVVSAESLVLVRNLYNLHNFLPVAFVTSYS